MRDFMEKRLAYDEAYLKRCQGELEVAVKLYINNDTFEQNNIGLLERMKEVKAEINLLKLCLSMAD